MYWLLGNCVFDRVQCHITDKDTEKHRSALIEPGALVEGGTVLQYSPDFTHPDFKRSINYIQNTF